MLEEQQEEQGFEEKSGEIKHAFQKNKTSAILRTDYIDANIETISQRISCYKNSQEK